MTHFRHDIDGLRAIAILLVVAAHAGVPFLAGGFVGVDVFFVLSGFLITGQLVREVADTGSLKALHFYVRRLRRLLPALLLMLLLVGWASTLLLSPSAQVDQFPAARMAALWLSNFHFALGNLDYFAAGSGSNPYLHTWSLGVEEQFYLAWPALVVWLLARDGERGVARLRIGLAVVAATSLLACLVLTRTEPLLAFYMMPMRAWQFAAGGLLWLAFARASEAGHDASRLRRLAPALALLGLLLIIGSGLWLDTDQPYPGARAILPTLGTALVVSVGGTTAGNGWTQRLLSLPPLQWLGRISYSWYLWHWPVLLLGDALTGGQGPGHRILLVCASLSMAVLSHALVEAPLRRWRKWLEHPRAALFCALTLMAAMAALTSFWEDRARRFQQSPQVQRYTAARSDAPAIYRMGCDDWYRSAEVRICEFGESDARHTAVVIGDSHVGQWFPAIRKALDRPGWRLLVITKSSCPMVDAPVFNARIGREYTECARWRRDSLAKIGQLAPDLLLLGSARYGFTREQWTEGTASVLAQASAATHRVFLLMDTPKLPFQGPDCLAAHAMQPGWLAGLSSCSAPAASARSTAIQGWLGAAAARFPNVVLLDMNAHVCPQGLCSAELDGQVVYRDDQHLTAGFAASLSEPMAARLFSGEPGGRLR